jgi:hypothetical protein
MISVCSLLLGFISLNRLGCLRVTKVVVDFKSLYCHLLYADLIVKPELDLSDRSEWIRIERYPVLCELHNEDVRILCGWLNFRKKSYVFVPLILIYFIFLFKFVLA